MRLAEGAGDLEVMGEFAGLRMLTGFPGNARG